VGGDFYDVVVLDEDYFRGRPPRSEHQLAYYDAQVWATAHLNQIPVIFSGDFQDGQVLEGVRFSNPFSDNFDLNLWIN